MFVHCLGQPDEGSLLWLDLYLPKSCSCTGLWLIAQYCPKQCSIKMSGHWYLGIGQSTGLGLVTSTVPSLPPKPSSIKMSAHCLLGIRQPDDGSHSPIKLLCHTLVTATLYYISSITCYLKTNLKPRESCFLFDLKVGF